MKAASAAFFSSCVKGKTETLTAQDTSRQAEEKQPVETNEESEEQQDGLLTQVRAWYQAHIPDFLASLPLIQARAFANFKEQEVSTRPANWFLMRELDAEDIANIVTGAQLRGEDLRGVNAEQAFLMMADLRDANLQEAQLYRAKLQEADLRGAKLQKANLDSADLLDAKGLAPYQIRSARNWVMASYSDTLRAELDLPPDHNARMKKKDLSDYDLRGHDLRSAGLWFWNLKGANLKNSQLQSAFLADIKNLTQAQLNQACVDEHTKLPEGLTRPKPCPEEALSQKVNAVPPPRFGR